jgi:CBS domain-containing protein
MTNGVTETAQDFGASIARQAEAASETLQKLASNLRETLSFDRLGGAMSSGLTSASGYLTERDAGEIGRDIVEIVRRYPVQAALVGLGIGWTIARLARRSSLPATESIATTRLKDVMTRNVETVGPDASLREAAGKMADLDVGAIPVCDGERLVGMLTDRDITVRAIARGADGSAPVREIMTSSVRYCYDDEPVERAVETMKQRKIRRLPILDRDRRLLGILSLGDLAVDANTEAAGHVLERVSTPARPDR